MNRDYSTIKIIATTSQHLILRLMAGVLVCILSNPVTAQSDRVQLGEALGLDWGPTPRLIEKQVTGLSFTSARIYLDGKGYSLSLFVDGGSLLEDGPLKPDVDLQTLRVGDFVLVETDHSVPSATHYPLIISIQKE